VSGPDPRLIAESTTIREARHLQGDLRRCFASAGVPPHLSRRLAEEIGRLVGCCTDLEERLRSLGSAEAEALAAQVRAEMLLLGVLRDELNRGWTSRPWTPSVGYLAMRVEVLADRMEVG